MAATKPLNLTDADFQQEVIQSQTPVLVDFWAAWCPPCRAIAPTIDELADEFAGRVKVAKVDVDANQQLANTFHIRSIPTLLLFSNGNVVNTFTGVTPKADLAEALDAILATADAA